MSVEPKRTREIYLSALKFSPQVYRGVWPYFLGELVICLSIFYFTRQDTFRFFTLHPLPVFIFFFLLSCLLYGYISCLAFMAYYKQHLAPKKIWMQFITLQKKWWGGMALLLLPALASIGFSESARHITTTHPYFSLTALFIATLLVCWSMMYLPVFIVYFGAIYSEPRFTLRESLRYATNLCCSNWWRIVLSSFLFYFLCFAVYDFSSTFYMRHIDKHHILLTNITIMSFIFYCIFPLIAAFNAVLVDDLRSRNTRCI